MMDHRDDTRLGELYQQLPKEDMPQPLIRQLMAAAEAQARQNAETAAASRLTARLQRWWRQQPLLAGSGVFAGALLVLVAVLRLMPHSSGTKRSDSCSRSCLAASSEKGSNSVARAG